MREVRKLPAYTRINNRIRAKKSQSKLAASYALRRWHGAVWGLLMFSFVVSMVNAANISPWRALLVILLCFYSANLFAEQITLAWNPSAGNVGGYRLYYGQASGSYTSPITVGNQTSHTITGLAAGTTYYFAVTAYDSADTMESGYSNEVSATIPVSNNVVMIDGFE